MSAINAEILPENLMLMSTGSEGNLPDRRRTHRYQVDWPFRVKGTDPSGLGILNTGKLSNISPRGAFGYIGRLLAVGMKVEVSIRLPLKEERWIKYSAEVVRVEQLCSQTSVALKFDTSRPAFYSK
ncbi:MAG: PilZ domain-containing protein [Blastocatellia bacterium]